jgi:hypothetical protein
MQAILRRSRGFIAASVAAAAVASALAVPQPAHANNPRPACGAWFHAWQYWTNEFETEFIRVGGDTLTPYLEYTSHQSLEYESLLHEYSCTMP